MILFFVDLPHYIDILIKFPNQLHRSKPKKRKILKQTEEQWKRPQINKNQKKFGGQQECVHIVYGSCLSRRVAFFLVFYFTIHPRVLFFEPFPKQRWKETCVRSRSDAANLDFLLVSPLLAPIRDHSPRRNVCFSDHKAGWTIRSKQRFHFEVTRKKKVPD